jgi:hypothetical protein
MVKIKHENSSLLQNLWWIFPVIILISSIAYSYLILNKKGPEFNAQTANLVDCLETENESSIDCWYERYSVLIAQEVDTKKAFEDVKLAYDTSPYVKSNCHQIAHIIGRAAGKKYETVSSAYQKGDAFCWSGYYHGVMEAITAQNGKQEVLTNINNICTELKNNEEYSFQHYNCVHGLGHGIMQLKDNELFEALKVCDDLDGVWQQEGCHGGVFMENIMNEINPGHTATYLKDDEPLYPCTDVEDRYKQQCYLMQTSHALITVKQDYSKVFELCSTVASPYDVTCYQSLGRDASGSTSSDIPKTSALCNLGKTLAARENCYIGAVKDFLSYYSNDDEGYGLCSVIEDSSIKATCNSTAESYFRSF